MFTQRYITKKIQQYKSRKKTFVETDAPFHFTRIRRCIHPVFRRLLHMKSIICGLSYEIISEQPKVNKNEAVIYAISHIGKYDYEMLVEAYDFFAYTLAGDWKLMYGELDDYFLRFNGTCYVDTEDKEDRLNSYKFIKKALKNGISMLIFPEGIWNLSESLPILKLYSGCALAAYECNVPIIPIAIEQYNKHFVINIGKKMYLTSNQTLQNNIELRDTLATLKWEIWEKQPLSKRADIQSIYYKEFIRKRLAEWPHFDIETIKNRVYKDTTDYELEAIHRDLKTLTKMQSIARG